MRRTLIRRWPATVEQAGWWQELLAEEQRLLDERETYDAALAKREPAIAKAERQHAEAVAKAMRRGDEPPPQPDTATQRRFLANWEQRLILDERELRAREGVELSWHGPEVEAALNAEWAETVSAPGRKLAEKVAQDAAELLQRARHLEEQMRAVRMCSGDDAVRSRKVTPVPDVWALLRMAGNGLTLDVAPPPPRRRVGYEPAQPTGHVRMGTPFQEGDDAVVIVDQDEDDVA
jgi:hypothetical protein